MEINIYLIVYCTFCFTVIWTMKYKAAVFVGLVATILYFDVSKEYKEQIWQYSENLMVWRTAESVLVDRFERLADKSQILVDSFFIGFNGNIDVILNGEYCIKKYNDRFEDSQSLWMRVGEYDHKIIMFYEFSCNYHC